MSNIITINNSAQSLNITVPAPVSNSQVTVVESTTAFISYDTLAAAGAGEGYVNIVTGDSRIIINKENNTVNISFDDTGLLTSETLTSLSFNGNSLRYSDEEGNATYIDLSSYLDNTNDFLNEASFNSNDGTLTLNVQNQPDVTVNLDGRYLTASSLGADLSDQYIPKYQSSTSSLVDSKEYETVNAIFVSTDNTADTAAIGLHYNPAVEEAITEFEVTATAKFSASTNGYYYANNRYLYSSGSSTGSDPEITILNTTDGSKSTVWSSTYGSAPNYSKLVQISSTRFVAYSNNLSYSYGSSGPGLSLFSFDGSTAISLDDINVSAYINGNIKVYYDTQNNVIWLWNGAGKFVAVTISSDTLSYVSDNQAANISGGVNDSISPLGVYNNHLYFYRSYQILFAYDEKELYKMELTGSFEEPVVLFDTNDYRATGGSLYIGGAGADVSNLTIDLYSKSIWFTVTATNSNGEKGAKLYRYSIVDDTITWISSVNIPINDYSGGVLYDSYHGILYVYHVQYDIVNNLFYYNDIYDVDSDGTLNFIGSLEDRIISENAVGSKLNTQTGGIINTSNSVSSQGVYNYYDISAPFYNNPIDESDLYLQEDTIKTKVELTYGDYSILPGDAQVDPISFFGLNTDGAIYAAKSPDSESHHWYTNEFSTGYYIKVMSLDQDGLIIYKASDETSAVVTKDSIDNWNYAYNNTIESLSFNSSTGVLTATQVDAGTLTVDLSSMFDDTNTTYNVSTSNNPTSGVDVNLNGSDSTTDSINIVGAADVTVTQANDVITISAPHETTTQIGFNSGTLSYRDEDGITTDIDLTGLSYDTTYDLNAAANATAGVDVSLVGSDSTTDTLNIKGANDVSVSLVNGDIVVDAPHETTTSLSFNSTNARLTYNDEDGTANIVSLASLVETVTSISFTESTNTITYIDESSTSTDLVLDVYDYEIALGTLASNTMPVVLNDAAGGSSSISILGSTNVTLSNPSQGVVAIASQDTTYDLNAGGTTNGTVTVTLTDGTNDDVVTIVGTNDVAVTQSGGTISIDAPHETTTSISFSSNEITYNDEDNAATVLNLDVYDYSLTTGSLSANQVPIELRNPYGLVDDVAIVGGANVTIGTPAAGAISISSQDTTYDLLPGGSTNGTVTITLTDGTNNDVINVVGTGDVTVTQAAGTITIDAPHETTTSISFASNIITYVDEDGGSTNLDLSAYVDTTYDLLKASASSGVDITLDGSDGTLDTVNFRGVNDASVSLINGNVTIDVPHETTTSISLANDTITYIDEDLGVTNLSLLPYLDNTDTTYSVSTTNAVSGANIVLTAGGSGSGTDSVAIVGGNNVTVTQAADVITVSAADETVTSISLSANILTYVDENGTSTNLDLSLYLDDTNLAFIQSGTLNGTTGIATFTRNDGSSFDVNLSALFDDTDSTYDLTATANATSGADVNLVAGGASSGTDTVVFRGANGVDVTASGGVVTIDGAVASTDNYVDALAFNTTNRVLTVGRTGSLVDLTAIIPDNYTDSLAFNTTSRVLTVGRTGSLADLTTTIPDNYVDAFTFNSTTSILTIGRTGSLSDLTVNLSSLEDYVDGVSWDAATETLTLTRTGSLADLTVSIPEADDLQDVCGRGNETDTNIIITNSSYLEFRPSSGSNSSLQPNGSDFTVSAGGSLTLRSAGTSTSQIQIGSFNGYYSANGNHTFYGGISSTIGGSTVRCGALIVSGAASFQSFSTTSSIRFKENIRPLEYNKEALLSLEPVRYDWKEGGKNDDVGLIAEDVLNHIPEVVALSEEGVVNGIDYSRLSVFLLQLVKEQEERINKLEELINNSK